MSVVAVRTKQQNKREALLKPVLRRLLLASAMLGATTALQALPAHAQQFLGTGNSASASQQEDERLLLDADTLSFNSDTNVVTVQGNVQLFFRGNSLEADKVEYNRNTGRIRALGKVRLIEATGNIIRSEEIELNEDFRDGFVNSLQIDSLDDTFFAAASGERKDGNRTILRKGVYSVCAVCRVRPGRVPTWRIKAEEIIIDETTHRISYKNASFELLGVPIAYLPRFWHPDPRVKQKTGILSPRFVIDSDLGGGVGVPFYYAFDESKDVTVTPTYLSRQGLLGDIEWRQRFAKGAYRFQLSGIQQRAPEEFINEAGNREFRGGLRTTGSFALAEQWTAGWDVLALTDRTFAEDYDRLTNRVDRFTSNLHLTGRSATNYFDAQALYFNILDEDTPLTGNLQTQQAFVHPVIDYDGIINQAVAGGQLSYKANFTSLSRLDEDVNLVNGNQFLDGASGTQTRASAEVEWKKQIIARGGHVITPSFAVRGDVQAYNQFDAGIAGLSDADQIARGQVTGGLEWRYPILLSGGIGSHVFEPIAQIFASPNETQIGRFLNEDSQSIILDDTNIFDRDRFTGFDRVEGGTRANVGFTHKSLWTSWLKSDFLIGQSFHLAGRNSFTEQGVASVYAQSGLQNNRSDIVGRLGVTFVDRFGLVARGRFDNEFERVNRGDLTSFYDGDNLDLAFGYTFIGAQPLDDLTSSSQIHGSFNFKPHEYWTLFGDARYDLDDNRFVNNRIGVAFDDRQVRVSFAFRQDFDTDGVRDGEGVELRVNFRTLGGF